MMARHWVDERWRKLLFSKWEQVRRSLVIGVIAAGILLILWSGHFFVSARLQGNDVYVVANPATDNIRIIALDDASFSRYGRTLSEWDRAVFADLIGA